jgi:hypothetical protein
MAQWTTRTEVNASPEHVEDLEGVRLAAGSRARVSGKVAGIRVGFDIEVHAADSDGLELTAHGPIGMDVRYELCPAPGGSEVVATVGLRRGGGLTGRVISQATAAMLSAGALDGATRGIARAAETTPALAA